MIKKPRHHQKKAAKLSLKKFRTVDRVQLHLACGTGKTLVGIEVGRGLNPKLIVVLAPTIQLSSQLAHEWMEQWPERRNGLLIACCDLTVAASFIDKNVDITVTTDEAAISTFLRENEECTIFSTYSSSGNVGSALKRAQRVADLTVFDEAHRSAGEAGLFGQAISDENLPSHKRLFLTATPRIFEFDDSVRGPKIFSMDSDEYGEIAYSISLREAIERGIVLPYRVILAEIRLDNPYLDPFEKNVLVAKAIEAATQKYGIRKILTFHRRVRLAKHFSQVFSQIHPAFETTWISGSNTIQERQKRLKKFMNAELALASNSKALSEGIDMPAIDAIAFVDHRYSIVDITQAIGRALRIDPDRSSKQIGYVIIPYIKSNGSDKGIAETLEILAMLALMDPAFKAQINSSSLSGRQSKDNLIEFLGSGDVKIPHEIRLQILDSLVDGWHSMAHAAKLFFAENGHLNVPKQFVPVGCQSNLRKWLDAQNAAYHSGELEQDKIYKLRMCGYEFPPITNSSNWWAQVTAVSKYIRVMGAPPKSGSAKKWYAQNFKLYRNGALPDDKSAAFKELLELSEDGPI